MGKLLLMFSSCFRQCTGSLREGQAVLQPSHRHHPRATLEAEGQERRRTEQLKAGLQSQELGNTGTRGMPTVKAMSLFSLLRNCDLTLQTF